LAALTALFFIHLDGPLASAGFSPASDVDVWPFICRSPSLARTVFFLAVAQLINIAFYRATLR